MSARGPLPGERRFDRVLLQLGRWTLAGALLASSAGALLAWQQLRYRAAAARGDVDFHGNANVAWNGAASFTTTAATPRVPLALAGPQAVGLAAGARLELRFRADPGYRVAVHIVQLESNRLAPPRLALSLNDQGTDLVATAAGGGLPLEAIERGTPGRYHATPPGRTRCGENRLNIAAVSGTWIGLERIELRLVSPVPAPLPSAVAVTAGLCWLTVGAAAGWRRRRRRRPSPAAARRVLAGRMLLVLAGGAAARLVAEVGIRRLEPRSTRLRNLLYDPADAVGRVRDGSFLRALMGHRCASEPCSSSGDGFRLNRHGFHTHEYAATKPPGAFRVLALGDSFAFMGGPVPYDDQLLVRLARRGRAARGAGFELINLGLNCIGVATEAAILEHEGLRLDPDLVLWLLYLGNDITDEQDGTPLAAEALAARPTGAAATSAPSSPRFAPSRRLLSLRLAAHLRQLAVEEPSLLFAPCVAPPRRRSPGGCGRRDPATAPPSYDPDRPSLSDASFLRYGRDRIHTMYRADGRPRLAPAIALLLQRMGRAQRLLAGRRVLVVTIPDELVVSPPARVPVLAADPELAALALDFDTPHRQVVAGLRRLGYPLLDLAPDFRAAESAGERLYHRNDSHLSRAGNHLAADRIADALERRGWLGREAVPAKGQR